MPSPVDLKKMLSKLDPQSFTEEGSPALLPIKDMRRRGRRGLLKAFICRTDLEICGFLPPSPEPCRRHHLMILSPELAKCLLTSPHLMRWGPWVLAYAEYNQPAAPVFMLRHATQQATGGHRFLTRSVRPGLPQTGLSHWFVGSANPSSQIPITMHRFDERMGAFHDANEMLKNGIDKNLSALIDGMTQKLKNATDILTAVIGENVEKSETAVALDNFSKQCHATATQSPLGRLRSAYFLWAGSLFLFGHLLPMQNIDEKEDSRWAEQRKINEQFQELLKESEAKNQLIDSLQKELRDIRHTQRDVNSALRNPQSADWMGMFRRVQQRLPTLRSENVE